MEGRNIIFIQIKHKMTVKKVFFQLNIKEEKEVIYAYVKVFSYIKSTSRSFVLRI